MARDLKPPIFQQAAELYARGMSVREVKQALGISHGEAGRLRLRAAAEGLLEPEREDERRRRKVRRRASQMSGHRAWDNPCGCLAFVRAQSGDTEISQQSLLYYRANELTIPPSC